MPDSKDPMAVGNQMLLSIDVVSMLLERWLIDQDLEAFVELCKHPNPTMCAIGIMLVALSEEIAEGEDFAWHHFLSEFLAVGRRVAGDGVVEMVRTRLQEG